MRGFAVRWIAVALVAAVAASASTPAAFAAKGKKAPQAEAGEAEGPPTLAATVEGMEKVEGFLTFYRSREMLYLELPADLVDKPMGFAATYVTGAGDFVMRGSLAEDQLVTWVRLGEHLVLEKTNVDFRAEPGSPMAPIVEQAFPDSPVFKAELMELAPLDDRTPAPLVIDAGALFEPDLAELFPDSAGLSAGAEDGTLISLRSFPDNAVARVAYRFRSEGGGDDGDDSGFARFLRPGRLADERSVEVVVDYHFFRLPEDDFRPRFADERIGGFVHPYKDYTEIDTRDTLFRHLLLRWDVRKSDPASPVSPAANPITFVMDRSVPERWRPLVKSAGEWWNSAFEKIGISGAVRVVDPPDDPDWDPADFRHSVIYWNLADNLMFSGAAGPAFVDPRTGKVLRANVFLNGEFFSFALNRYLVYAWWRAPEPLAEAVAGERSGFRNARERMRTLRALRGDPRFCDRAPSFSSQIAFARLVLQSRGIVEPGNAESERFAREAFEELVAHEVGHALGFPHNWKASLGSSWADVAAGRVTGRAEDNIFSTSVMDYNPIYLAPRGAPQGDYFLRELGPYDDLAVAYLYAPTDGMSAEEEAAALDAIAARAEVDYGLVYDSGELGDIDPTSSSDDFGDDPLAFADSRLAILHDEVLPRLPELVLGEGHDYSLLRQALDAAIFSVAMDYVDIAARHVGGQELLRRVAGSPAAPAGGPPPIVPVEAAVQRRALDVLERHVFADGRFALDPAILAALKADLLYDWNYPWRYASDYDLGGRVAGLYGAALDTLLEPARLRRVLDNERRVAAGGDRFTLPELFGRLEAIAFDGLAGGGSISADRRSLQRLWVDRLADLALGSVTGAPAEASQLAAAGLASIQARIDRARKAQLDPYAAAHLADLARRAERTLAANVILD